MLEGGLDGALGVDGGWLPLPTRPQQYCDPASLVINNFAFSLFSWGRATLKEALSIHWSIHPSIRRSVTLRLKLQITHIYDAAGGIVCVRVLGSGMGLG